MISAMIGLAKAQSFNTAVDYHNYILAEQEKVVSAVIEFSNHFNSNDSILLENYQNTKSNIKSALEDIRHMPPFESDSSFRDACIPLFELYYSAMDVEYREMVDLFIKKDFSKKTQDRVTFLLNSINEREKKLDYRMKQAQADFAQKFNLDIKTNPVQNRVNELKKK